jgi:preprotein translocase subunit SecD
VTREPSLFLILEELPVRGFLLPSLLLLSFAPGAVLPSPDDDTRRDVNKVGGTILVYEVDTGRSPDGTYSVEDLTRAVRQRLDSGKVSSLSVRPAGKRRLEILIPRGAGNHNKDVERVKALLARTGTLEFRILANKHDDAKALVAAEAVFKNAVKDWKALLTQVKARWPKAAGSVGDAPLGNTSRLAELILKHYPKESAKDVERLVQIRFAAGPEMRELLKRAKAGLPPPPPQAADRKGFKIELEDGRHQVNYRWVVLGKRELKDLKLDDGDSKEEQRMLADKARREGVAFYLRPFYLLGGPGWQSLLYSRAARPGARKKYDYFVLTRDPEPGKAVTGAYLKTVREGTDQRGSLAVDFRFTKKGAELFGELTTANRPPEDALGHRHIAIVLDGQIMSAPSLKAVIREAGQISGKFSRAEIEALVNILRSGALPATLKPLPVSEQTVSPTKDGN